MKIKEMCTTIRPYEKCISQGPEVLSDEELLAVIIRCGTKDEDSVSLSRRILSLGPNDDGVLNIIDLSMEELMNIKGIGNVKAIQIKCIGELSKRIAKKSHSPRMTFTTADRVADYFMEEMRHLKREKLMALFLDAGCNYLGEYVVSTGTVNASIASARDIYVAALKKETVNIILVHNHPSGNPSPSVDDVRITSGVRKAGEIIGIKLIDHVIIGDNKYMSFKEMGIMN